MTEEDNWIVDNINYRLHGNVSCGKLDIDIASLKDKIPTGLSHFMAIHENKLISKKEMLPKKLIRPTRFLKYCNYSNFNSSYFVNFCDAQGWDYTQMESIIEKFSIIQFSRRKSQRKNVVLWPLDRQFMNIEKYTDDEVPFEKKYNSIVWRGRVSGTYKKDWSDFSECGFWIQSVVKETNFISEDDIQNVFNIPRYKIVNDLYDKPNCNVKFTTNDEEYDNIENCEVKLKYFKKLIGDRLDMDEQKMYKYILVTPGNCYPTSLYWSMLSNSVVFLLDTEWETILDCNLKPWVHYVPVKDYTDLAEKFEDLQKNPEKAIEIIESAHEFLKPYKNCELRDKLDYLTLSYYNSGAMIESLRKNKLSFTTGRFF